MKEVLTLPLHAPVEEASFNFALLACLTGLGQGEQSLQVLRKQPPILITITVITILSRMGRRGSSWGRT